MSYKYNENKTVSGGCSISTVLFIVFLILKLVGVIDWPWIWVFSPLWIGLAFALVFIAIIFFGIVIAALIKRR